ncbi:hypothetical protein PanWU01x14_128890, partial [Parasponia andersonii]
MYLFAAKKSCHAFPLRHGCESARTSLHTDPIRVYEGLTLELYGEPDKMSPIPLRRAPSPMLLIFIPSNGIYPNQVLMTRWKYGLSMNH